MEKKTANSYAPEPKQSLAPGDVLMVTDALRFFPGRDDRGEVCFVVTVGAAAANVGVEALGLLQGLSCSAGPFGAGAASNWLPGGGEDTWDQVRPVLEGLIERGVLRRLNRS